MTTPTMTVRNAELGELVNVLQAQHVAKLDVVTPTSAIRAEEGHLVLTGTEPQLTDEGVTLADGLYLPTATADAGIAAKLDIPVGYLRRMREAHTPLYDANVNGWLEHETNLGKRFLVRAFRNTDGGTGVARAFLSDSYKMIDNLDTLYAALEGIKAAGVPVLIQGADLTERRMHVKVYSEAVTALAPTLLRNYRSPFTGQSGRSNPTVFAGFVIQNSEVGSGAATITPRIVVQVCSNGQTITADAVRAVHLGAKLDEGIIRWSEEAREKSLDMIKIQTRDAVRTFLDVDYLSAKIREIEAVSATPVAKPEETIKVVTKALRYSDEMAEAILGHFIKGADVSAGGVLHAITSVAQTIDDADVAAELEADGIKAMHLAARAQR